MYIRFYNFMAECIAFLIKKQAAVRDFEAMAKTRKHQVDREISAELPELLDKQTGQYGQIQLSPMESEDFFKRMYAFQSKKKNEGKNDSIIRLLQILDLSLGKRAGYEMDPKRHPEIRKSLNHNAESTGVSLLPRAICNWERRSRAKQHFYQLDNYIRNFYFILDKDLRLNGIQYHVEHIFLPTHLFGLPKDSIRIGVSPLDNAIDLTVLPYEKNGVTYFSVESNSDDVKLCKKVCSVLERAGKEGVDILLFPEMLGSEHLVEKVKKSLLDGSMNINGIDYPALTVLPSVWSGRKNTSTLLDAFGRVICGQQKHSPFFYPREQEGLTWEEGIEPDPELFVLHCVGIGRIALVICKDFLNLNYLRMLIDVLKVTLILSPSFSTGYFDFENVMKTLGYADGCAVWVNTCSVMRLSGTKKENFDVIGSFFHSGKNSEIGLQKLRRKESCLNGLCERDCMFSADLPLVFD